MKVNRSRAPLTSLTLRQCRNELGLSQTSFAVQLGVSLETYRAWDSGRRSARPSVLTRANELALRAAPQALRPLPLLARLVHVHVKTLYAAVKDGRLNVTYDTRTTFRNLRARATVVDIDVFMQAYFEKGVWPKERPAPLRWSQIPSDYDDQIRRVRHDLGLTQAQFAARRRGPQSRRLPVGIAAALSLAAVLATHTSS
jgi:DNA-binding transcriptional regulator YiaG